MDTVSLLVGAAIGILLGAVIGFLVGQSRAQGERRQAEERAARAEAVADEVRKQMEEEKALLAQAAEQYTNTFKAIAGDALRESRQDLLSAAEENLTKVAETLRGSVEKVVEVAKGDLEKRQEAIGGLIKPVEEALKGVKESTEQMEHRRQQAFGGLEEQLKNLAAMQETLRTETRNLSTALRRPIVRGRWGEATLRNLVELSGMSKFCDFDEQVSTDTEEGRLRPDMLVRLPGERIVVVDSKVPLEAYLDATEATDDEIARSHLARHAQAVRNHIGQLSSKKYQDQFDRTPDHVVMFIPGESFFAAALEADRDLISYATARKVVLASPGTLLMMLSTVAYMWRQEKMARNAEEISKLGQALYDRVSVLVEHVGKIGKALNSAVTAYNDSVGSLDKRVLPTARKFRELGVQGKEIEPLTPIETSLRPITAPETLALDEPAAPPEVKPEQEIGSDFGSSGEG
ncbi:MAG: DNA recombination protein RmuC [Fimbriimonadia bacterium]|jgi:DNA recombination protein RmuC